MRSKIDTVKFGVRGPRMGVHKSLLSSRSPRDVAWVSGTSVVSISLREVEAEDSYCHQGVNRWIKRGLISANTASEIKGRGLAEGE